MNNKVSSLAVAPIRSIKNASCLQHILLCLWILRAYFRFLKMNQIHLKV